MDKNKKIIMGVIGVGVVAAVAYGAFALANKKKKKPLPEPEPILPFFTELPAFTKLAAQESVIKITNPMDIQNAGTIEFDYSVNLSAAPGGGGQPIIRIGEHPACFEIYISGMGALVFRTGGDPATEKYEKSWIPEANKTYRITIGWSANFQAGSAFMKIDDKIFTSVSGLNMTPFTSHNVLVFPPGAADATYSNIKLYN